MTEKPSSVSRKDAFKVALAAIGGFAIPTSLLNLGMEEDSKPLPSELNDRKDGFSTETKFVVNDEVSYGDSSRAVGAFSIPKALLNFGQEFKAGHEVFYGDSSRAVGILPIIWALLQLGTEEESKPILSELNVRNDISFAEKEFKANHEVFYGNKNKKVVLMTYDDFNSPKNIEIILDAYKAFNAKATFFFPGGYSREYLTITNYGNQIERIVDEGHVLGCHGLLHDPLTTYNENKLRSDLELWLKILGNIIPGYKVDWIRFPFGDRNDKVKNVAAEFGMQSVMWSLESNGTDEKTYERVTSNVKNGDIVLSHTQRYYDAYQAHKIVENIAEQGYSLENVETGLDPKDYYRNYLKTPVRPNNR